jgi:hypothetical protein
MSNKIVRVTYNADHREDEPACIRTDETFGSRWLKRDGYRVERVTQPRQEFTLITQKNQYVTWI